MKINNYFKTFLLSAAIAGTLTSCVKDDDWSIPEILCHNKFDAPTTTMADFALLAPLPASATQYSGTPYTVPANGQPVIFDGYIVSSDENGNFYKTISFQDKPENPTIGMQIEVDKSSNYADFPVGAHVRIKANGLRLAWDRGTLKIGSVDPTYSIGRIPSVLFNRYMSGVCNDNNRLDVATIVPTKVDKISDALNPKYINTLVQVADVQFDSGLVSPTPKTFIEYIAGAGQDTDRGIVDKFGGSTVIRSSGYSTYGSEHIPAKSGTATFVVSKYNANYQMVIRGLNDLNMTNPRFATGIIGGTNLSYSGNFVVDFEAYTADFAAFPEYINYAYAGNRYWQIKTFNNNKYIQMSANAGSGSYQTMFIVPVDFTAANKFAFNVNVGYYNGNPLKVYTTTDYIPGEDISTATLTDITSSFTIPTTPTNAYGTFASAGSYDFPSALAGKGFIVFKYEGSNPGVTTTIQLDNIVVD